MKSAGRILRKRGYIGQQAKPRHCQSTTAGIGRNVVCNYGQLFTFDRRVYYEKNLWISYRNALRYVA